MKKVALRKQDKLWGEGRLSPKAQHRLIEEFGRPGKTEGLARGTEALKNKFRVSEITDVANHPGVKILRESMRSAPAIVRKPLYNIMDAIYHPGLLTTNYQTMGNTIITDPRGLAPGRFVTGINKITKQPAAGLQTVKTKYKSLLHELLRRHEVTEVKHLSRGIDAVVESDARNITGNLKGTVRGELKKGARAIKTLVGRRVFSHIDPKVLVEEAKNLRGVHPEIIAAMRSMREKTGENAIWRKATGMNYPYIPHGTQRRLERMMIRDDKPYGKGIRRGARSLDRIADIVPLEITPKMLKQEPGRATNLLIHGAGDKLKRLAKKRIVRMLRTVL